MRTSENWNLLGKMEHLRMWGKIREQLQVEKKAAKKG